MRSAALLCFLPLFSLLSLLCACDETKAPAPDVKAPFAKGPSATELFNVERKGDGFAAGDKSLQTNGKGLTSFVASGKAMASIYMPFFIVDSASGERLWVSPAEELPRELFEQSGSSKGFSDGKFVFKKTLVFKGLRSELSGSLERVSDKRVRLSFKWQRMESPEFKLVPSTLMIDVHPTEGRGSSFSVDGERASVPENANKVVFHKESFKEASLFAGDLSRSVKLVPVKAGAFFVDCRPGEVKFRVEPQAGADEISVDFDISEGPEAKPSVMRGGIDFAAVEGLELPDFDASKNFIQNPSFEKGLESYWHHTDYSRSGFSQKADWSLEPFVIDPTTAKFGSSSLKMLCSPKNADFRWVGYQLRSFPVPLSAGTYTVSVYAKGEAGRKQRLSVWIPGVQWLGIGHTYLPVNCVDRDFSKGPGAQKVFTLNSEWKRCSFSFELPGSMPAVVSFGADSENGGGHVWVDGLQLEAGAEATDFQKSPVDGRLSTSRPGNFLDVSDKIDAKLELSAAPGAKGEAVVSVKDFYGEELLRFASDFVCDGAGKSVLQLPFDGKLPQGIFVARVDYSLANGVKNYELHRLSVMKFLKGEHRLKEIFSEDYGEPENRCDFLKLLERYRRIGIGSRCQLQTWDKAVWDACRENRVTPIDAFMFSPLGRSIDGFALRDPFQSWRLSPDDPGILVRDFRLDADGEVTEVYLAKLKAAAAKIAKDHPWIPVWGPHCELLAKFAMPSWWDPKGSSSEKGYENLAKVLKAFEEGVKEGNPAAKVYSDQPCNMSQTGGVKEIASELAALNKIGAPKFDYIGIHPYRSESPETIDLDADAAAFFKTADENGYAGTPAFWGEGMHYGPYNIPQWRIRSGTWGQDTWFYGALSYGMGWTERISAAWRARSWLVALKYQDRVKCYMSGAQFNNFEMDVDFTPFSTQKIPNTLGNLLGDAVFKKDVRFAPYIRAYVFEDSAKRPVVAVWCHHPKIDAGLMNPPRASINFGEAKQELFDLMMRERAFTPDAKGDFSFTVSSFPLFFRGEPGSLASSLKALENASLLSGEGVSPLSLDVAPCSPESFALKAKNYLSRPFSGVAAFSSGSLNLDVPASSTAVFKGVLPLPLRSDRIVHEDLSLSLKAGEASFVSDLGFDGFVCPKSERDFSPSCDLEAWKDFPAIKIAARHVRQRGLKPVSDKDFSAWFKSCWTPGGLHLLVKTVDDKFVPSSAAKPRDRWDADSLQIYIDTLCSARGRQQRGYSDLEYEYGVFPNADGKSASIYRCRQPDVQMTLALAAPPSDSLAPDIPSAFKLDADGCVYEVFIPAKYLLPARLEKGQALGLALMVNDSDDPSPAGHAKLGLMTTPPGTEPYNNPHVWPAALLW